jgi:DNA-binding MarR family transcriptional regulator
LEPEAMPQDHATATLPALLERGSDQRLRRTVQSLLAIAVRIQHLQTKLGQACGLSGPQYSLMVAIDHLRGSGRDATVSALAAHLRVSSTFVTAECNRLEAKRLIRRIANPKDRRSMLLEPSRAGEKLLADILPMVRSVNDAAFAGFGRTDLAALDRLAAQTAEGLERALALPN